MPPLPSLKGSKGQHLCILTGAWSNVTPNHTHTDRLTETQDSCRIAASASTVAVPPQPSPARRDTSSLGCVVSSSRAARCNYLPSSRLVSQEDPRLFLSFSHRQFDRSSFIAGFYSISRHSCGDSLTHSITHIPTSLTPDPAPACCAFLHTSRILSLNSHQSIGIHILRQRSACL